LVREDLQHYFPKLVATDVKITLIEALDHVLSMMVFLKNFYFSFILFSFFVLG
jgi:hypothetical protein